MCIFDFSFPIGWNELGVIATALAVIIALWANRQSKKQLISALEIQEQSKNIELLDKRVDIIENIEKNNQVPSRMVKLLFGEEIVEEYKTWLSYKAKESNAEHDISYYLSLCREAEEKVVTIDSVDEKIEEYKAQISMPDCPNNIEDEFKLFCDKKAIYASETGQDSDYKHYNYYELSRIAGENYRLADDTRKSLIKHMEQYIEGGLEPLSDKKKRKGGKAR